MNTRLLSSFILAVLFFLSSALGDSQPSLPFVALGILAVLTGRRDIAFLSCAAWGGFFVFLLLSRNIPVTASVLIPLLVVSFWEALAIQRTLVLVPEARSAMSRKSKRVAFSMLILFCATMLIDVFLATFALSSPLFFVVILSFFILLFLYFFASKDF